MSTTGTSAAAPLTVEPAPGVDDPTLDGNGGVNSSPCSTALCDGPVLTVGDAYVDISGITVQDADNSATEDGGAIDNSGAGPSA